MIFRRRWICACALLLGGAAMGSAQPKTDAAERFPYRFDNFVWWSDSELRLELHKRLPKLEETIPRNSVQERQIHDALVKLLRRRGIHAEVQSMEPPSGWEKLERMPEAPPPAITFSVLAPPKIIVGSVDAPAELSALAGKLSGREYAESGFWYEQDAMERTYRDEGYLAAKVRLQPGTPSRQGENWSVPLKVSVEQGPLFHVGTVKVDGGPLLEGRNLQRFVAVHPGEVARGAALGRLELAVGQFYRNQGYADVRVRVEPELDREHGRADYVFRTEPGQQYRVRKVSMEGLSVAQEGEVREMLGLGEGEVFDLSKLQGVGRAMKSSPGLVGETYSFSYVKDQEKAVVDIRLEFRKAGS